MPRPQLGYTEWNERLAAHFFQPSMAGRQVYLYVTEELLTTLGAPLGTSEFVSAVKIGPPWIHEQGLCQRAYHTYLRWQRQRRGYPPYIAYLALFVLAAGLEGDFASHAYYPRLRMLIGEPPGSTLPSFDLMQYLWSDLERWSGDDKHGELGIFTVRVSGSWLHVGLPIAQAILTEHERKALPKIFSAANLDPTSPPSDPQLVRAILHYGGDYLRSRTMGVLRDPADGSDVRDILIVSIRDELLDWDGSTGPSRRRILDDGYASPDAAPRSGAHDVRPADQILREHAAQRQATSAQAGPQTPPQQVHASLRLCISKLDRVARKITIGLRCSTRHEFPDIGLRLRGAPNHAELCCEEALQGWSSLLADCRTGNPIDAAQFNWAIGLDLRDVRLDWSTTLSDSQARIFVSGASEGLPGMVEINQLPRQTPVYIAAAEVNAAEVWRWGQRACRDFKEIAVQAGLPPRWRLFQCAEVVDDKGIRELCPSLSFTQSVRLALSGGIRSSRGNSYFYFSLPRVALEGGDGSETLFCNDLPMTRLPNVPQYGLPEQVRDQSLVVIEARRKAEVVFRLFLNITHEVEWQGSGTPWLFDRFGMATGTAGPGSAGLGGPFLIGVPALGFPFAFPPHVLEGPKVVLIGRFPGQVRVWPTEAEEQEWTPIWAIQFPKKKLGRAIFCGDGVDEVNPCSHAPKNADRKKLRLWKEVLWYSRKRIAPPARPDLRALWSLYEETARDLER